MSRMRNTIQEIISGAYSLAVGMKITICNLFRPTVTLHYPHESATMPARFRGHVELACDPETGKPKCVVCMACQRACPSGCISLDGQKSESGKGKVLTAYSLDFSLCSLCGLCVESCKFDALRFSKQYNLAFTRREECTFNLLERAQVKK